jgi:hypothetical protein
MRFPALVCFLAALAVPVPSAREKTAGKPEAKPKAVPTAWGKPANGLQAGIRLKPSDPLPGSIMEIQIVIRNVGKKKVVFHYSPALYFWGESDDGVVVARSAFAYGGYWSPGGYVAPDLAPGKEYTIASMAVHRPAAKPEAEWHKRTTLRPGTYRVGADRVELQLGDRKTVELGTGYLDVEIPPEKK